MGSGEVVGATDVTWRHVPGGASVSMDWRARATMTRHRSFGITKGCVLVLRAKFQPDPFAERGDIRLEVFPW